MCKRALCYAVFDLFTAIRDIQIVLGTNKEHAVLGIFFTFPYNFHENQGTSLSDDVTYLYYSRRNEDPENLKMSK